MEVGVPIQKRLLNSQRQFHIFSAWFKVMRETDDGRVLIKNRWPANHSLNTPPPLL